jgi:hypothetical protein
MFCDLVQKKRVELQGQCPARRPVFLRTHGIMKGTITFLEKIPKDLQQGLFGKPGSAHPVYVRYSSDLSDGRPDWMSTIGIGIKIFDVPGEKLVSDNGANTADLLLQNVPFFFVDNAKEMCSFTKASLEGWGDEWVQENSPKTNQLLNDMEKPIRSVFETQLWSVVPFKLGDAGYCKYILPPLPAIRILTTPIFWERIWPVEWLQAPPPLIFIFKKDLWQRNLAMLIWNSITR